MDKNKVERIQSILLENTELHVKLLEAFGQLAKALGDEKVSPEDFFNAISAMPSVKETTHEAFWGAY